MRKPAKFRRSKSACRKFLAIANFAWERNDLFSTTHMLAILSPSEYCYRMRIMRVSGSFWGIWKLSVVFLALFLGMHERIFNLRERGRLGLIYLNSAFESRLELKFESP